MAKPPATHVQARQILVNALIVGDRVTLFDLLGRRVTHARLSEIEAVGLSALSDTWKWQSMMELKLWRLKQQVWKLDQDPWQKKAQGMAERFRAETRSPGTLLNAGKLWRRSKSTPTWKEACKRMHRDATVAYACARAANSKWRRWVQLKACSISFRNRTQENSNGAT
jgi:hypothetical protein